MRIAIDTTPLGGLHSVRGTGAYTKLLVEALQKYETKHSYHFFTQGQKVPGNVDIVHYPYFDPFFLTLPLLKTKPTVVTVHDLIPIVYSQRFPRGLRGTIKWNIQRISLLTAFVIVTDSEASKQDIHKFAGVRKRKIRVVYLAPAEFYRKITDKTLLDKTQRRYGLQSPYILYVGDVNWNKNVSGLLKSFAAIKSSQAPPNLKLVLVGRAFTDETLSETSSLVTLMLKLNIADRVIRPGYVPDEDMPALYNMAKAYIQPSLAEGFGLPVLEAMACGCPVICSNTSSLAEIAGPALLVDPQNFSEITDGILKVLHLPDARMSVISEKGREWARQFSWRKVAAETVGVYEKIFAGQ